MTADEGADGLVVQLTDTERHVVRLVTAGRSNKATARELAVTVKTVEFHLSNVYRKLGVVSRTELAHLLHEASPVVADGAPSAQVVAPPAALADVPAWGEQRVI